MRLIDADALLETFCSVQITIGVRDVFPRDAKDTVLRIVDEQPTIDPYKHGKWTWKQCVSVDDGYDLICSCCKSICDGYYDDENGEYLFKKSRFCPNCGAKMD